MPKINFDDSSSYSGNSNYFSLSDNGDKADINILIDKEDDIEIYAVHTIETKDGQTIVNCLREPQGSMDDCPLCAAKNRAYVQIYLKLINEGQVKVWTRGKTFYDKLKSLLRRYKPLSATTFEVEREGKKGDPKTTYGFYEVGTLDGLKNKEAVLKHFKLEDAINILGDYVKDYSYDELCDFLDYGTLPDGYGNKSEAGGRDYSRNKTNKSEIRRRPAKVDEDTETPEPPRRRPAKVDEDEEAY